MDAVTSKLEAMVLTNPDWNTTSGKKQAGCLYYRRNRAKKAKYNAEYYQKHQYSINRNKAVKRGNSRKQKLKETIGISSGIQVQESIIEIFNSWKFHHLLIDASKFAAHLRHDEVASHVHVNMVWMMKALMHLHQNSWNQWSGVSSRQVLMKISSILSWVDGSSNMCRWKIHCCACIYTAWALLSSIFPSQVFSSQALSNPTLILKLHSVY